MNKIVFECIQEDGNGFTISMESDNRAQLLATIPGTVAAYRRQGIEVISASAVEEMAIDLDLHATPIKQPVRATSWLSRLVPTFSYRPMWIIDKAASFGGLSLAIIGFDDGFSIAGVASHVEKLFPAFEHMIHLA